MRQSFMDAVEALGGIEEAARQMREARRAIAARTPEERSGVRVVERADAGEAVPPEEIPGLLASAPERGLFALERATLRRVVGDDARYAGDAPQFVLERGDGDDWLVLPPPVPPRNPTWRNGAPLAGPAVLAAGDTLSIGPVKSACTVSFGT